MNEMIKMVVVLTVLSLTSGVVLGGLNGGLKGQIENQEMKFVKGPAVKSILAGSENDAVNSRFKVEARGADKTVFVGVYDGEPKAVAFEVKGKGYGDAIGLMVGFDVQEDQIFGIGVTTHKETPGLGAKAKDDPSWAQQFKGLPLDTVFKVTNDGGAINALSGATITSRGVCAATADAVALYKEIKPKLTDNMKTAIK